MRPAGPLFPAPRTLEAGTADPVSGSDSLIKNSNASHRIQNRQLMPPVYQFERTDSAVGTARGARLLLMTT